MSERRKMLFILIDQLRADCISGALADHVKLVNINALRQDAVTFTQHFSVTNPCGPARASILTGKYAMNHRSIRNGTPMSDGMPNMAREMRKSGYDPVLFGYTDTSIDPRIRHPNDPELKTKESVLPDFREVLEMRYMESYPWRAYLKSKGYDIPAFSKFYDPISPDPNRPARADDPPFFKAKHSDTAFLTDAVINHLSVRTDDAWFAMATYLRPHPPLVAPKPYNRMYKGAKLPLPERMDTPEQESAVHPFIAGAIESPPMQKIVRGDDVWVDSKNDKDVQLLRALYLGLATEVDTHIGRIIEFLKETEQYDQTLIVVTADHGEMLGDHHMWGKQHVYDPAFRAPLIIRDPENAAQHGTSVAFLTESIDVTPTILDLMGRQVPDSMDGRSLRPFLEGKQPDKWKDCVHLELEFGEPNEPTAAQVATGLELKECNFVILRERRFKLVHFNGGLPPLLFDMDDDPFEMQNLADNPDHAGTLLRLTQKLLSHRMKHADHTLSGLKITEKGVVGQQAGQIL